MVDAVREGQGHAGSTPATSTILAVVSFWVRRLFCATASRACPRLRRALARRWIRLEVDDAALNGGDHGLRAICDAKLGEDALQMTLRRVFRDTKRVGDLLVGAAAR